MQSYPHKRDPLRIDIRALQGEVDYGRHDLFPVRPEGQPLAMQRPELPRTVEDKRVVAALYRRTRPVEMHLFRRTVESAVHDDGRPGTRREIGAVKVARKRCAAVGDLDRLDRRIEQRRARLVALHGSSIGASNSRVAQISVEEEL